MFNFQQKQFFLLVLFLIILCNMFSHFCKIKNWSRQVTHIPNPLVKANLTLNLGRLIQLTCEFGKYCVLVIKEILENTCMLM